MKVFVNAVKNERVMDSFFTEPVRKHLESVAEVTYNSTDHILKDIELKEALKGQDVLFTGWGQPLIKAEDTGDVKMIIHTGGTVGGIVDLGVFDTDVKVLSGNQYYAESVAEGVIAYMLYALRKMEKYPYEFKAEHKWDWNPRAEGLLDQTIGIISLGAISKRVIGLLKPYRAKIKVYSTRPNEQLSKEMGFTYASLDEIFKTCKVVSVHTAKTPETFHMINDHHFKLLQDGAIFMNTSRGPVIDEEALIENLKENRFRAVLDVYDKEPLPDDSPLYTLPNVIIFPHMAGPTYDRRAILTDFLINDMENFFTGKPIENEITKEVAEKMTKA